MMPLKVNKNIEKETERQIEKVFNQSLQEVSSFKYQTFMQTHYTLVFLINLLQAYFLLRKKSMNSSLLGTT